MMLTFGVGCTGVNQCGPLQASILTLMPMVGVIRPLMISVTGSDKEMGRWGH